MNVVFCIGRKGKLWDTGTPTSTPTPTPITEFQLEAREALVAGWGY